MTNVSFTNRYQHFNFGGYELRVMVSNFSMKIVATVGDNEEPIVVPLVCS